MLPRVPHPKLGTLTQIGIVPKLSATPGAVRWPGPELGQDTHQVLKDLLKLGAPEIAALEAQAVVRGSGGSR